jgi:hypothetical protein
MRVCLGRRPRGDGIESLKRAKDHQSDCISARVYLVGICASLDSKKLAKVLGESSSD